VRPLKTLGSGALSRLAAIAVFISAALVLATPASATVRKVRFTAVVSPNDYAVLTVNVSPRARCSITVVYDTTVSHARGLGPKTGGRITWRWKVGSSTHAGRWPVRVNCGTSGKLALRLRVLPG
jgi:acyl dehydratase